MNYSRQPVWEGHVKQCDRCGDEITFHRNRDGNPYAVSILRDRNGPYYNKNGGMYKNLTPWHRCTHTPLGDFYRNLYAETKDYTMAGQVVAQKIKDSWVTENGKDVWNRLQECHRSKISECWTRYLPDDNIA